MDDKTLPHIGFEYPVTYPDELINKDVVGLLEHGLKVDTRQKEPELMATIEWAIPTAFIVYLLKPYFESFLAEAGKDSYEYVKKKLTDFIVDKRKLKTEMLTSSQSTHKLSKSYDQSHSISIFSKVHDNLRVTVLFNNSLDDREFADAVPGAIDSLLLLRHEIEQHGNTEHFYRLTDLYMIMNVENKTWELLNMKQMSERYRNV